MKFLVVSLALLVPMAMAEPTATQPISEIPDQNFAVPTGIDSWIISPKSNTALANISADEFWNMLSPEKQEEILRTVLPRLKIPVHTETDTKIDWVGHPMVSDNDAFTPSQGWLTAIQIGLRPDGVVVWRKAKAKAKR